jgi:hypothetical protein
MLLSFFLSLATFLLLLAFTVFHLSKTMEKKPPVLEKVMSKMAAHMDALALWSVVYGLVASVLVLLTTADSGILLVNLAANILITLMALPFSFDNILVKIGHQGDNPAIIEEARNLVNWVIKNERFISYAGVAVCIMLFAVRSH